MRGRRRKGESAGERAEERAGSSRKASREVGIGVIAVLSSLHGFLCHTNSSTHSSMDLTPLKVLAYGPEPMVAGRVHRHSFTLSLGTNGVVDGADDGGVGSVSVGLPFRRRRRLAMGSCSRFQPIAVSSSSLNSLTLARAGMSRIACTQWSSSLSGAPKAQLRQSVWRTVIRKRSSCSPCSIKSAGKMVSRKGDGAARAIAAALVDNRFG